MANAEVMELLTKFIADQDLSNIDVAQWSNLGQSKKMVNKLERLREKFQVSNSEIEFHLTREADPSSETTPKRTLISNQIQVQL